MAKFAIVLVLLASLVAVSIANPPYYPYGEYNGYYGSYDDLAQFGYDRQISSYGYYTGPTYPYDYDYNGNSYPYVDSSPYYSGYADPYELP